MKCLSGILRVVKNVAMPYLKTIVCFANSRKLNARCVAGREWDGNGFGGWIRPVTASKTGEIGSHRFCVKDEKLWDPQLLSVLRIPLLKAAPSGCQTENHIIEEREKWKLAGSITFNQALGAVVRVDGPLWINGHSTSNGHNDEIPATAAEKLPNSLMLIHPRTLEIVSAIEGAAFGRPRRRVRGRF